MQNKDVLENIDALSVYISQAKADIGELVGSYRALAGNADAAIADADEAYDELGKLLDAIESGEAAINDGTEFTLEELLDMSTHVIRDVSKVHKLYADIEKASNVLTDVASTQQDVIGLSRDLRKGVSDE